MTNLVPLGEGAEFDKIRAVWRALGDRATGGGDDCALVRFGQELLAISTDLALEGVHFLAEWLSPEEVGWRAAAAALSDLAAVAAEAAGVLVSLGVPAEWSDDRATDLMSGVGAVAASVGARVWGGDLVRSASLVIDVVVVGRAERPVLRSGARVGDEVWVTGSLGGPLTAIECWKSGGTPPDAARRRFAHPEPRIQEGRWLRDRGATALIDVSDGLVADAGHVAAASGVQVVLNAEAVPLHSAAADNIETALVSGEEFELLATFPPHAELASAFADAFGFPLTRIGRIEDGSAVTVLRDGAPIDLPPGFRHF